MVANVMSKNASPDATTRQDWAYLGKGLPLVLGYCVYRAENPRDDVAGTSQISRPRLI